MEIVDKKNEEINHARKQRILKFLVSKTDSLKPEIISELPALAQYFIEFMALPENYPFRDMLAKVQQFHETFGIKTLNTPYFPSEEQQAIRYNLLKEEMDETIQANADTNLPEAFDGLVDQLYILMGTFDHYGMSEIIVRGFLSVHDSNMTKLGEDGKPMYRESDGKVIKGPNFVNPNAALTDILVEVAKNYNDKQRAQNDVKE